MFVIININLLNMKKILVVVYFLTFAFACKEKIAETSDKSMMVSAVELADTDATSSENEDLKNVADTKMPIETKIIKNADLRFESSDLEKTYATLAINIKKTNAIIQSDAEIKTDYNVSRNLTIRIPSKNFDAFVSELSKGVSYFDRKEISSRDVTAEYIDTDSRIASKKKLELRYLELLKKANKVQEMLEIEKQLSTIREEIEAKEGQLKYLQNQVSMSTINIEFYKNMATESGVRVSFFGKIWTAIVSGFNSAGVFLIYILEMWPFVLGLIGIIYLIRKRRLRKRQI